MATITKRARSKHIVRHHKMPETVKRQLKGIYTNSLKRVKKHPYQMVSSLVLSASALSAGAFFLIRYLRTK